jgi:hypothetical protein
MAERKRRTFDRAREARARRGARRQGMTLVKLQRRDERALGWNRWMIYDDKDKLLISRIVSGIETGASLEEIEHFLATGEKP